MHRACSLPLLAALLAACDPASSATQLTANASRQARQEAPLPVGSSAPDFSARAWRAGKPETFRLSEALRLGPVVVYFFPAAYTPGCNIEAHLFSQAVDRFRAAGASVIGVTAGNAGQLARFSVDNERCAGKFPVAADPGAAIAARYGALLKLRPGWSNRTSFLIGRDGRVLRVHSDAAPEGHVEAMLAGLGR